MFWLLFILSLVVLFLFIIFYTKLTILISYYHHNDNDDLQLEFKIWAGLIKYKKKIPFIKVDDDSPSVVIKSKSTVGEEEPKGPANQEEKITPDDVVSKWESAKDLLHQVIDLNVIVRHFLQKISIKKFEWYTLIGVGDAAHTGMVTGVIWGIKGSIIGLLSHYFKLKVMPDLSVTPHFQAAVIQTRVSCIFQFRIGHAILAGLKLIKFWKGTRLSKKANFSSGKTKTV